MCTAHVNVESLLALCQWEGPFLQAFNLFSGKGAQYFPVIEMPWTTLPLFNQQQVPLSTLVWRMQSSPQVASSSVWISGPLYIIMSYPCQSGLHVMSSFDLRGADLCDERLQEWHSIPTNKNVLLPHRSWYTVDEFMLVQFSWNSRLLSRAEGRKKSYIFPKVQVQSLQSQG